MSRVPVISQISWSRLAINLMVLLGLVSIGWRLNPRFGILIGALAYLVLSRVLRGLFTSHHRQAIRRCRRLDYSGAIPYFEASLSFFRANPWIDQFRAITMLSASAMSYQEMALVSLGLCYGQVGNGQRAQECYRECLELSPDNAMAIAALQLMDSARKLNP